MCLLHNTANACLSGNACLSDMSGNYSSDANASRRKTLWEMTEQRATTSDGKRPNKQGMYRQELLQRAAIFRVHY